MKTLLLAMLALPFCCLGQVTVQANYNATDYNSNDSGEGIIATPDGFLLKATVLCKDFTNNTYFTCTSFIKADTLGLEKWKKLYDAYPTYFGINNIQKSLNGGYLACGSTDDGKVPHVMEMDGAGDTVWYRKSPDPTKLRATAVKPRPNGKIIVQGYGSLAQAYQHLWVMQLSATGEKEWDTVIDVGSPQYIGGGVEVLPNGDLAFGYQTSPVVGFENTLSLTRTDSTGNVKWTRTYASNDNQDCVTRMTALLNGGFALSYCIDTTTTGGQFGNPPKIYGTDGDGNLVWNTTLVGPGIRTVNSIRTASNGDIIGCGTRSIDDDGWYAYLFRMTQDGHLLWQRAVRPASPIPGEALCEVIDLTEAPDGGIAAVGYLIDTLPGGATTVDVWLLKLDGDGCLTPGCTDEVISASVERRSGILESTREVFFRLSPNPAAGEARLSLHNPAPAGAEVTMLSAQGRPLARQAVQPGSQAATIDLGGWPAGLYFVTYRVAGRALQTARLVKMSW